MKKKVVVAASVLASFSLLVSLLSLASIGVIGVPAAGASPPSVVVSQTSGLLDGQLVSVSGSGLTPQGLAEVIECNDAPGQPTVDEFGFAVPVSCNFPFNGPGYPYSNSFGPIVGSDGTIQTWFVVHTGIVGPPTLGIDSAGHNTAADAALYPCPPTPVQQAAGDSCEITVGDISGDHASVAISFGSPITTTPSVTIAPALGLASGDPVSVSGLGFTPGSPWLAMECNLTPGEPLGGTLGPNLPVSCDPSNSVPIVSYSLGVPSFPSSSVTDSSGDLATTLAVAEGNIGQSQQSQAYPCPPSPANLADGGKCAVVVEDGSGKQASFPMQITGPVPVPTITVTPSTALAGGSTVQVNGTNFSANQLAGIVECNNAPNEPTISYDGIAVPVGCSVPQLVSVSGTGTFSSSFQIIDGVTGPPTTGTDSSGGSAASDALSYPCPPTLTQQAAGVTCTISAGDLEGDVARQPISFAAAVSACSAVTGNAAFLCKAYEDLLGRAPDSAGLSFWETLLSRGVSRSQVGYDIDTSPEYRVKLVDHYYTSFLNRPADDAGSSFWVSELAAGMSDQSVLEGILGSSEFYADSGGTASGFVTALYQDLLARTPDPGGLAFWESLLAAGSARGAVAGGIISSDEYKAAFVSSQYTSLLGRLVDPAGLSFWLSQMAGGASDEAVIAGIVGSAEYYSLSMG